MLHPEMPTPHHIRSPFINAPPFNLWLSPPGAEGRGGKQGPGPPLKYSAPVYIYN